MVVDNLYGMAGLPTHQVLVEFKRPPVHDNLGLFRAEFRKQHMRLIIAFSKVGNKGTRGPHTSVSSKMGLFINTNTAESVRSSWVVKLLLPLLTSIIPMLLCAKKSMDDRCSMFFLMINIMYCRLGCHRHRVITESAGV